MRSFSHVDDKLAEADFFLSEIEVGSYHLYRARHLFSAFVSACRSVTFALQASMSGTPGFEEWYGGIQGELKREPLARFFHDCRTDAQHLGLNPVQGLAGENGEWHYFFGQPELDRHAYVPDADVVTACRDYMRIICGVIDRAYVDFGLFIDPDQVYTPEGLRKLGRTLEDVEEELGFPAGFTDIPGEWPDKADRRLALLRRNIPGSGIKPVLVKYLGRELSYPISPYEAG